MNLLDDYIGGLTAGVREPERRLRLAEDPARPAGEMQLEQRDGAVMRIRVPYERFSG